MASKKNTFGWIRAEVVGALVNAVFLLALCFTIFVEGLQRLVVTETIENPQLLLIVGSMGLLINIIGLILFGGDHGHSHGGHSHDEDGNHGHSHVIEEISDDTKKDLTISGGQGGKSPKSKGMLF